MAVVIGQFPLRRIYRFLTKITSAVISDTPVSLQTQPFIVILCSVSSKDCLNLSLSHSVCLEKNKTKQNAAGFAALAFKYCSRALRKVLPSYMVGQV